MHSVKINIFFLWIIRNAFKFANTMIYVLIIIEYDHYDYIDAYNDETTGKCKECSLEMANCLRCEDETLCIECMDTYYISLDSKSCVSDCSS